MNIFELKESPVFRTMQEEEIAQALSVFRSEEKHYQKGETVLLAGNITKAFGIVLEGSVTIENNDFWGNRTILSIAEIGDFFAEVYAILGNEPMLVDVRANEDCRILFLNVGDKPKGEPSDWHIKFLQNLLLISARKNLMLSGRAFHISPKTIRERVEAYLNSVSLKKQSKEFDIPFDRQQLADYLNVERTALSKELGKMKRDGIIDFRRRHFILCGDAADNL
ncbi:MAG: Crp/Fnr family transcriptional regulator [Eubacterium sp.]|nr:Crp/Fnr family transcriptional regulator [Eubacterium sp.]